MTDDRSTTDLSCGKIQMAISSQGVVRSTSCLVLQWGFRGRRIEWRYFRFDQIQDGGSTAILKNSNGGISAMDRRIHSVFGSRMGFLASADRMALFRVGPNSTGTGWPQKMAPFFLYFELDQTQQVQGGPKKWHHFFCTP